MNRQSAASLLSSPAGVRSLWHEQLMHYNPIYEHRMGCDPVCASMGRHAQRVWDPAPSRTLQGRLCVLITFLPAPQPTPRSGLTATKPEWIWHWLGHDWVHHLAFVRTKCAHGWRSAVGVSFKKSQPVRRRCVRTCFTSYGEVISYHPANHMLLLSPLRLARALGLGWSSGGGCGCGLALGFGARRGAGSDSAR